MRDLSSLIADRWQPIETVEVPLTLGQVCIIDRSDLPFVQCFKWHARPRRDGRGFYAANSSGQRMHRLLLGAGEGEVVDHKDGNGLNNRRSNLRKGTQSQNCVNRRYTPGSNLRGTRRKKGKWQSYIKYQGIQRSLGYFDTPEQAHQAYLIEARRLHGDWMPLPPLPPALFSRKAGRNEKRPQVHQAVFGLGIGRQPPEDLHQPTARSHGAIEPTRRAGRQVDLLHHRRPREDRP